MTRGRSRTLGVRTWLGAGALALGVGAALAGAAGVAQADTGAHHASSSASGSTSDAGPKRTSGVASTKRVSAPIAKVNNTPVSAAAAVSKPSAKAKPSAAVTPSAASQQFSQTINTPFGPISLVADVSAPDPGQSGPVSLNVTAKTPIGGAKFSLAGNTTFTTTPLKSTTTLTDGTLVVPPTVAFAASAAGAVLGAGLTAYDSLNAFVTAAQSGNIPGAFIAWAAAAPKFTNALLFGTRTLDLPLQSGGAGPAIVAHIPIGGVLSPLRSVSVSWDDYSYVDGSTGATIELVGGDIDFAGSKFGGAAPAFLKIFGL
ncbi:hypothetical protein [Mycobacterium sp. shizuoka-1]|uniref:hypothetical protein n=1 Tax=Mycobacterium sp. shizuoka-1 TaxID=2039281 RepID=UPI001E315BFF|nr:hypothetical protein [Mycobacterium sp. shizuoka-1]